MKEDALFLAHLEDKVQNCLLHHSITYTSFLNLHEHSLAKNSLRKQKDCFSLFWGGYEDAARVAVICFPAWIDVASEEKALTYFIQNEENNPFCVVRVEKDAFHGLSHRDYLGALTGLGIKREKIGDILLRDNGTDIIVQKTIAAFLADNFTSAGRASLQVQVLPVWDVIVTKDDAEKLEVIVPSMRIDAIISAVYHLSRKDVVSLMAQGKVYLNHIETYKTHTLISDGDIISVRGKGRFFVQGQKKTTKKGNLVLSIEAYK